MSWRETRYTLPDVLREKLGAGPGELELVGRLLEYYDAQGLLDSNGMASPLFSSCGRCEHCWPSSTRPPRPEASIAGIAVPWVGPGYSQSRLCVVAINGNKFGGLSATWWITKCDIEHRRGNAACGGESTSRHVFYAKAARYLSALLRKGGDFDPDASVPAPVCAEAWSQVAYLQAVKCSPGTGTRGSPTQAMVETCPPRYLASELEILTPARLLVVGKKCWASVSKALDTDLPDPEEAAGRATAVLPAGGRIEVFFVAHPGGRGDYYRESVRQLADLK